MATAVGASDVARARVAELSSQVYQQEEDAVAERQDCEAAELALREELAGVQDAAHAAAARFQEEGEQLHADLELAASEWDGVCGELEACTAHVEETSRSVDLSVAVSAAFAGKTGFVPGKLSPAVRAQEEPVPLEKVLERTW